MRKAFFIPVNSALNTNANTNLTSWLDFFSRFMCRLPWSKVFFVWECHIGRFFSVLALQKSGRVKKRGLNVIVIDPPSYSFGTHVHRHSPNTNDTVVNCFVEYDDLNCIFLKPSDKLIFISVRRQTTAAYSKRCSKNSLFSWLLYSAFSEHLSCLQKITNDWNILTITFCDNRSKKSMCVAQYCDAGMAQFETDDSSENDSSSLLYHRIFEFFSPKSWFQRFDLICITSAFGLFSRLRSGAIKIDLAKAFQSAQEKQGGKSVPAIAHQDEKYRPPPHPERSAGAKMTCLGHNGTWEKEPTPKSIESDHQVRDDKQSCNCQKRAAWKMSTAAKAEKTFAQASKHGGSEQQQPCPF